MNGRLCVAVRAEKFFASERADLDTAGAAMKKAGDDLKQAEVDLNQAGREPDATKKQKAMEEARKRIGEAQKQLDTAKTAVNARSTTKTVTLFIDDVRTPVVMDFYINDPKPSADGLTWKSVRLASVQDAKSDAGKAWRQILSGTPFDGRPVTLGFGDSDGKLPRPNAVTARTINNETITLRAYVPWSVFFGGVGLLLVAAGLVIWGWNSSLLRDQAPDDRPASRADVRLDRDPWPDLPVDGGGWTYLSRFRCQSSGDGGHRQWSLPGLQVPGEIAPRSPLRMRMFQRYPMKLGLTDKGTHPEEAA